MIKLFCSDYDNTLAYKGRIPKENAEAIFRLQEAGVDFALVTGRHLSNARMKLRQWDIESDLVASNGAISQTRDGETLATNYIPEPLLAQLYDHAVSHHLFFLAYSEDEVYVPWYHYLIGGIPMVSLVTYLTSWTRVRLFPKPVLGFNIPKIVKVSLYVNKENMSAYREEFLKMEDLEAVWSSHNKIEIEAAGVSKMAGVEELMEAHKLTVDQVAGIGDQNNDLAMLEGVGLSMAVGNAQREVRAQADQVFSPILQGGFVEAVDYVLERNKNEKNRQEGRF